MEILPAVIYVVRHGQTEWNVKKKVMGHLDIELDETGKTQARNLAMALKKITFEKVFSSDLLRCRQTAEIILLERNITIETTKVLRERNFGRLQGKRWDRPDPELDKLWSKLARLTDGERKKHHLEGVENDEDILSRFITFLREMAVAYPGKNILVVTHSGLLRLLLYHTGYLQESDDPDFADRLPRKVDIKNTAYIRIETDGSEFTVKETSGIEVM